MVTRQWLSICVVVVTAVTLLLVIYRISNKPPIIDWAPPVQETPLDLDDVNLNLGPPQKREATLEDALNSIKEDTLKEDLYYLASDELEGRMSGKKGNRTAAEFIKQKFESFGLKTAYDRFPIRRSNPGPKSETGDDFTQNIYAWIEGTDPLFKDEIVVIGAHMDHIGYGPSMSRAPRQREVHNGADDNGSGTVALLEIAEAFSMLKDKVKRTVVFQAYSAEEMGLIGSRHYCDNPMFPLGNPDIKKHVFMLNMDMVGWLDNGQYLAFFNSGDSSPDVGKIIRDLGGKYLFAGSITSRGASGSDHASFYNKRIPIAFLHTGLHNHYHTPTDDPDLINYNGLTRVTTYAFELAWTVVQSEQRPAFNHEGFKAMSYTHDHGHPEVPFERQ